MNKYSFLIIALSLFAIAAIVENGLLKKHPETHLIENFREKFHQNEKELSVHISAISGIIKDENVAGNFTGSLSAYNRLLEKEGIGFLVFESGQLKYWSDRSISFFNQEYMLPSGEGFLELPNGYFFVESAKEGNFHIYGFHLIKYSYDYENKYLENTFSRRYNLPDEYIIEEGSSHDEFVIQSNDGSYLFSIEPAGAYLCTTKQLYIPGFIYLLGLLILLAYFRREFLESKASFFIKLFSLAIALFLVYWLHLIFEIPKVFFYLDFFSPSVFALNSWLPSLGDYFLLCLFFLFWMYNFGKHLEIDEIREGSFLPRKTVAILLLLFAGSIYLLIHFYIRELIFNSTISFLLNRIIEISVQSVIGIFSAGMLLLSVFYFNIKIIEASRNDFTFRQLTGIVFLISLFLATVQFISVGIVAYDALGLFIAASLLASLFSKNYLQNFTLSYLIIFVSAASLYSLVVFYRTTAEKQREEQKLMAVTLVAERDPAAEVFLNEIQDEISVDPVIPSLLIENEEGLVDYIEQTYFNSYFRKYERRYFVCSGADSLFIQMENRMAPCFDFFGNMIETQGVKIPGTSFYFMDNMNGRISYTGRLHYPLSTETSGVSIFIELNSDLLFEGIGFPELLIDKSMEKPENYKKYNYAKYYGGELTDKHGDYN